MYQLKRSHSFVAAFVFCLVQYIAPQPQAQVAGAYQRCPFHCESYQINKDWTFNYIIDGDLFNNQRTSGTWGFVGKDKIRLKAKTPKFIRAVSEEVSHPSDRIVISARDAAGAVIRGLVIQTEHKSDTCTTNEDGQCSVIRSRRLGISWLSASDIYFLRNPAATLLIIDVDLPDPELLINAVFLVKTTALCKLGEQHESTDICFTRVSKNKARKLFPSSKKKS